MDGARIVSLNLNEDERPGGMKVRIKIQVESGRKGRARDARQGQALKEYVTWVVQQDQAGRQ
jgi:hypothetical protein